MTRQQSERIDSYPTLSQPFESMRCEYDVIVVGSGYGAGIAASRMARAGKTVAVLELGWERRPGSFPRSLPQCLRDMNITGNSKKYSTFLKWFPSGGSEGVTRLFQLVLGHGQHAFKAHGLGGCSLINAGVFLEADVQTLSSGSWPEEIRADPLALKKYYSRAADMLQPSPYPEILPSPKKLDNLREQFGSSNFYRPPLTTFFSKKRNSVGVEIQPNTGSGMECTGLNDGSKNTVATTYLTDAWNWGAEIFCGCEVRCMEQDAIDQGYIVHFQWHDSGRAVFKDEFKAQKFWLKAKEFCFLGAGSIGTTEILLRSKQNGMEMSPLVGKNLSGNGDLLVFSYNGRGDVNGIARESPDPMDVPGPTITGVIDYRNNPNSPLDGSCSFIQTFGSQIVSGNLMKVFAALKSLVFGAYAKGGAVRRTATYLIMSRDVNEISVKLQQDKTVLRGPAIGSSSHLKRLTKALSTVIHRSGAKIGYSYFYGKHSEEVTVHPLGGANMSRNGKGNEGVVNHLGEIFTGYGSDVYPGLVCCDASVIPTSLGVNPLATICALAERSLDHLAHKYGFPIDVDTQNSSLETTSNPERQFSNPIHSTKENLNSIGWRFTEVFQGQVSMECFDMVPKEYGKSSSCAMQACLTVDLCRKNSTSFPPQYQGTCIGTVSCFALSRAPLRVISGHVVFFTEKAQFLGAKTMSYYLQLSSVEGAQYSLDGHKIIDSTIFLSISKTWEATTTLSISLRKVDGTEVGSGDLKISLPNFWRQLWTFRPSLGLNMTAFLELLGFIISFAYYVIAVFFCPIASLQYPGSISEEPDDQKRSDVTCHKIKAIDNVQTRMEIYSPLGESFDFQTEKPPVLFLPGVTGVEAEHQVYSLPYLECNMVDYFVQRGHRCYTLTPRWGCEMSVAERSTVYDCRLDVAAAVNFICAREIEKPYVVAHCQGSVALGMALLDGTIQANQLLGITANSVFMNQTFAYWNSLKGQTSLLINLYELLAGNFFPIFSTPASATLQWLLDQLLRMYPVNHCRDVCSSTACHRTSFGFGLLWNHENLNQDTHNNVHRFFAGTHTKLLIHVVKMGTQGQCVDNMLQPLLTEENLERLRGVPILLISGTDNEVFDAETTLRDYEMLRSRFGEQNYRRFLADGYGHLDPIVGKNAAKDVYWRVYTHLEGIVKTLESRMTSSASSIT